MIAAMSLQKAVVYHSAAFIIAIAKVARVIFHPKMNAVHYPTKGPIMAVTF